LKPTKLIPNTTKVSRMPPKKLHPLNWLPLGVGVGSGAGVGDGGWGE